MLHFYAISLSQGCFVCQRDYNFLGYNSLTFFFGGGGRVKVWTFLSVINSSTESLYRKMNNIFVMYSCCSIFTKQLIFRSINFAINESNNPVRENTEKLHCYSYFGVNY